MRFVLSHRFGMYVSLLLFFSRFVRLSLAIIFPFFSAQFQFNSLCFFALSLSLYLFPMIISKWCNNSTSSRYRSFIYKHCFYICKSLMESFCMTTSFLLRCYCCCSLLSLYTFPLDDFLSLNSLYFRNDAHFSPPMDFNSLRMNWRIIICMHTTV